MSGQREFAAGLTGDAVPSGVVGPDGAPSPRRFSVYRNNVASTLIEALGDNFPLCRSLVGERFFDAMADVYRREHPPRSPILFRYGDTFPDFAAAFAPARSVPYLADLARLEWAWLQSHHAADAVPLDAGALAAFAPDALAALKVTLHPALAIVRSRYPIVSIATRLRADDDLAGLDLTEAQDALLTRPALDVALRLLPPGAFAFIEALAGQPLGSAAEIASAVRGFDLAANIAALFEVGAVIHLESETTC